MTSQGHVARIDRNPVCSSWQPRQNGGFRTCCERPDYHPPEPGSNPPGDFSQSRAESVASFLKMQDAKDSPALIFVTAPVVPCMVCRGCLCCCVRRIYSLASALSLLFSGRETGPPLTCDSKAASTISIAPRASVIEHCGCRSSRILSIRSLAAAGLPPS